MPDNEMSAEERAEWIASRVKNAMGVELRESIAAHIKDAEAAAQERGRREGLEEAAIIIDMTCKFADARACLRTVTDFAVREILIATAIAIRSRLTKKDSE